MMANTKCKECGCVCPKCTSDHDVHLHVEIENLKAQLVEKHNHIVTMETNFLNESNKYPNGELLALHDELLTWQDKYKRLYDAHRRIQRVNQGLEDKLLRLVDISETDKSTLTKDVATLSYKLAEANYSIKKLTEDNERYKNDVSVAIQFLQCKPGNFVSQKFDTLPNEVQAKVSNYMGGKRKTDEKKPPPEIKSIKVPIPTFPPTAMVYSVPKSQSHGNTFEEREPEGGVDIVSAAIMAKVLEERARERACIKHCDTCTCSNQLKIIHNTTHHSIATQTTNTHNNGAHDSLCLQCNNKIERPTIQIVKGVNSEAHAKNKAMPVYIHEYNESITTNVAKVQPNNFLLNDANDCSKLRKEAVNSTNKLGSVRVKPIAPITSQVSDDLIDLGTPSTTSTANGSGHEVVYFANERPHKKALKVKTHEQQRHLVKPSTNSLMQTIQTTQQPLQLQSSIQYDTTHHKLQSKDTQNQQIHTQCQDKSRSLLFDSVGQDVQVLLPPMSIVPDRKPSSLSSGDQSEMTSSELLPSSSSNHQRVEEWMDSMNLTETATLGSGTDCSESLLSSHNGRKETEIKGEKTSDLGAVPLEIDTHKYKEMEDNVKKFLLGEYNILNDVKKSNY